MERAVTSRYHFEGWQPVAMKLGTIPRSRPPVSAHTLCVHEPWRNLLCVGHGGVPVFFDAHRRQIESGTTQEQAWRTLEVLGQARRDPQGPWSTTQEQAWRDLGGPWASVERPPRSLEVSPRLFLCHARLDLPSTYIKGNRKHSVHAKRIHFCGASFDAIVFCSVFVECRLCTLEQEPETSQ